MRCPSCGGNEDRVVDSRAIREGRSVRRRRECLACGERFTTYESIEVKPVLVIKRDGRRVPYERRKIVDGLVKACVKRPVSLADIQTFVEEIERDLVQQYAQEVPSRAIGQAVLTRLRSWDEVAYVRYASVYRSFTDLAEFLSELRNLQAEKDEGP